MTDTATLKPGDDQPAVTESDGPEIMSWDSGMRRIVTIYIPLVIFLIVLLFPFFWMGITAFKPNVELMNYKDNNPFWINSPTLSNINKLLFETDYGHWLVTTMGIAFGSTFLSLLASVLAAYAIQRLRFRGSEYVGLAIYAAYLVPPSILFIPLAQVVYQLGLFDTPYALILTYPTFLVPFCTWLLIGYFKSIPYELEECALIDGATRLQSFMRVFLPLVRGGIAATAVLCFVFSWTEFLMALFLTFTIRLLPVQLSLVVTQTWGFTAALSTASILPGFVFILLVQKHLVRGLTLGVTKG
jgi:multiple sugar transport system permease protein